MSSEYKRPIVAWLQLLLGVLAMMTIAGPQYVWTLYVAGFQQKISASVALIQITFSLVVIMQCWLAPIQGYFVERFGHRRLCIIGMSFVGLSWIAASHADSIWLLFLTYGCMGGLGVGIVYLSIVSLMVKWFPDRKGFSVGAVAAGYGFGAIVTTFPINSSLLSLGFDKTLTVFGFGTLVFGLLVSLGVRAPRDDEVCEMPIENGAVVRSVASKEMLKTSVFWTMFLMMALMASGGLMVVSQFALFAKDFGVSNVLVFGSSALPLALTIDRIANGITRPFFGWVSDHMGRERTMFVAFLLEAAAIAALLKFAHNPTALVLLSGLVFFGWGEIFSLFPATHFGRSALLICKE